MPKVPDRPLSRGELEARKRVMTKPEFRLKRQYSDTHIGQTAKAWGISEKQAFAVYEWLVEKVAPHQRSRALTTILRRKVKP